MPMHLAKFIQFTCSSCKCSRVIQQHSDALITPDICVNQCHAKFEQRRISSIEASILQPDLLLQMAKRFLSKSY
jgi:hypothetical protein